MGLKRVGHDSSDWAHMITGLENLSFTIQFSNPALSGLNRISIFEIILKKNIKTHGNEILPVCLSLSHTHWEYTCDSEHIHETCIFNCRTILTRASCSPSQLYKGKGQSLYFSCLTSSRKWMISLKGWTVPLHLVSLYMLFKLLFTKDIPGTQTDLSTC